VLVSTVVSAELEASVDTLGREVALPLVEASDEMEMRLASLVVAVSVLLAS
jgi:hypothetical protein